MGFNTVNAHDSPASPATSVAMDVQCNTSSGRPPAGPACVCWHGSTALALVDQDGRLVLGGPVTHPSAAATSLRASRTRPFPAPPAAHTELSTRPFPPPGSAEPSHHAPRRSYPARARRSCAPPPPLQWNAFAWRVTERGVRDMADRMISLGLAQLGYTYLNVDDTWSAQNRTAAGALAPHPERFPSGMKALGEYIHGARTGDARLLP